MRKCIGAALAVLCLLLASCARFHPTEIRVETPETVLVYVINTSSRKFHHADCAGVRTMKESNREDSTLSRDELIDLGYAPCGTCDP